MKKKQNIDVLIENSAVIDDGDGVVRFAGGLTLSDESTQKNGTKYDIASMDLSQYDGTVFADHDYSIQAIVGKSFGVAKQGARLVAEGIRFAMKNPLGVFTYNMLKDGMVNQVSIGTLGELDEEDTFRNARLLEWSFVGIANNDNAKLNSVAKQTIEYAEANGLDTKELRDYLAHNHVEIQKETAKPEANKNGDKVTNVKEVKNMSEVKDDKKPEVKAEKNEAATSTATAEKKQDNSEVLAAINKLGETVETVKQEFDEKIEAVKNEAFNKGAKEPEFKKNDGTVKSAKTAESKYKGMDWKDLTGLQVENAWKMLKQGDQEAAKELHAINDHNLKELKAAKIAKNTLTMADFGNFVTNPELITEIQGYRSDFSDLLREFPYQETNSLRMAWLVRSGDINMQPVELCDDGADGNLKPVSEYTADDNTRDLEELAAVTPVCNAATIFMAADLLADVAGGYRTDYDRKLAQGVVAELEAAIEADASRSVGYTASGIDTAPEQLEQIRIAIYKISQGNGIAIMNEASFGVIQGLMYSTGNGGLLSVDAQRTGVFQAWTKRILVVPNELMPTLGDSNHATVSFSYQGSTKTINHAIFYVNPSDFRGRQNGGLRYDLSTEAAYEVDGTVYSAYQRNEMVVRGSMFRGAAILDPSRVSGVRALDVIS